MNPFTEGTQKHRIFQHLWNYGSIEVWRLITPRPHGLGIAQYNARIKEMRDTLDPMGWEIHNRAGKHFKLVKKPETGQDTLL